MSDSPHLFEADKVRIANEAKVRTALEQPDFAEREFEKWRAEKDRQLQNESFATVWAKVAWLAEGRMHMMGRELDKLQQRIGRQRRANRRQHHALKVAHERIELLEFIAQQTETYLQVSTPYETPFSGPALTKRELETSLEALKALSGEHLKKEDGDG